MPTVMLHVRRSVFHSRYGHPLRFYITPHFVKWSPVATLKLRLVSSTASRPRGFTKQALCKVACAGVSGVSAFGAARSLSALCAAACAPWCIAGGGFLVRRCALWLLVSGLAAKHHVCAPPTLWASPLRGVGPARPARPPPRGSLRAAPQGWQAVWQGFALPREEQNRPVTLAKNMALSA